MSHLTDEQLNGLRDSLLAMREQMDLLISQTAEDSRPVELSSAIGRLTRIDAIQMRGLAQMSRGQLKVRRQQVALALEAFEAGTYGACRHCGGPIGLPRLEALPETPFCIACQEGFEGEG